MADHGVLVARNEARDLESFLAEGYDHPMEPVSDLGSQYTATYYGPW